jgi:hypothetical protein
MEGFGEVAVYPFVPWHPIYVFYFLMLAIEPWIWGFILTLVAITFYLSRGLVGRAAAFFKISSPVVAAMSIFKIMGFMPIYHIDSGGRTLVEGPAWSFVFVHVMLGLFVTALLFKKVCRYSCKELPNKSAGTHASPQSE